VKQIVAAHGGSVEARSSDGEGTAFTVRLPAQPAEL
jgi:signal transduction histidine kinase